MMLPLFVAVIYKEYNSVVAFTIACAISFGLGIITTSILGRSSSTEALRYTDSYFIVSFAWIMSSVLAAIPFVIQGSIPNVIDAFFEMCSGFSTTGATILTDVEALPKSMLLWRSETQWLGGMGIVVLMVALVPNLGVKAQNVASAETPGPTVTKLTSRFSDTARSLYIAYVILTVILIVLLLLGGMSMFDAVAHSFSTMATGGFGVYNDSVAHFHSYYITWVIIIFMIIAGTNFNLFFTMLGGKIKTALADEELRLYAGILAISTTLITISLLFQDGYKNTFKVVTDAAFQVATMISTTGYATADFNLWPAFCKMVLILVMFTGAMSSSTAGGIKIIRVLSVFKMFKREVRVRLHDNIIDDVKYNGTKISGEVMMYMLSFVITFLMTLGIGTMLVSLRSNADLVTDFTAVLSCISNVGPGLAQVGPIENFHFYSDFSTFVLALIMIIGRLELSTFLIMFSRHYWNRHRV
ncbi:TrkH family potassium uptake protein [Mogibacterium diversum]|uniref:TrkH family potassium uptake protein n=1 Tax=Mogibacterium diversum TaxID=114527 RepID=UPI0028D2F02B|nr:TrkH family potassium uptake protein [Mogibacterium diversum]